jgi:hypothetical protein
VPSLARAARVQSILLQNYFSHIFDEQEQPAAPQLTARVRRANEANRLRGPARDIYYPSGDGGSPAADRRQYRLAADVAGGTRQGIQRPAQAVVVQQRRPKAEQVGDRRRGGPPAMSSTGAGEHSRLSASTYATCDGWPAPWGGAGTPRPRSPHVQASR